MLRKTVDQADCAIIANPTFNDPAKTKCTLSNMATTQVLRFHTPSVELGRMYKLRLNRKIIAHSATASALKDRQSGTGCVNQFMLR
jgi:hypothetical protein